MGFTIAETNDFLQSLKSIAQELREVKEFLQEKAEEKQQRERELKRELQKQLREVTDEPEYWQNFVNDAYAEDDSIDLPVSRPVHMSEEQKRETLNALSHESLLAFSELYANFVCDCEKIGIRVSGIEFYPENNAGKPNTATQP